MLSFHVARRLMVSGLATLLLGAVATTVGATELPLTLDADVRQVLVWAPPLAARAADLAAMREEAVRAGRLPGSVLTVDLANYPVSGPGALNLRSERMTSRMISVMQAIPSRTAHLAAYAWVGAAHRPVDLCVAHRLTLRLP